MQFIKPGKSEYYNHCYDLEHYFPTKWNGPIHIFDDKLSEIAVYGMEGFAEPHFHIITDGYPDICIKIMTNEYYGNPSIILNEKGCKNLNNFLRSHVDCEYRKSINSVWYDIFDLWNNAGGNVGYGYYEAEKYLNHIPDYSVIHYTPNPGIPDPGCIDTAFGICKIGYSRIHNCHDHSKTMLIDIIHGKNIIASIDIINKIVRIDCRFVKGKYRENLYFNLNDWLYNELSLRNIYIYNYQCIIMDWLHFGLISGIDYLKLYYDHSKLKTKFINNES